MTTKETKAIADLAKEIVLSPTAQRRIAQRNLPPRWAAREAVRFARGFLDLKLKRGESRKVLRPFFVERAADSLDLGVGKPASDLMERVRINVSNMKTGQRDYEALVAELVDSVDDVFRTEEELAADEAARKAEAEAKAAEEAEQQEAQAAAQKAADEEAANNLSAKDLRDLKTTELSVEADVIDALVSNGLDSFGNVIAFASTQKLSEIEGIDEGQADATIAAIRARASDEAVAEIPVLKSE